MTTKTFDASKYLTDLNGRDYLEVKWRLLWLRTDHPDAVIETELVKHEPDLALFRARVAVPGAGEATGWGSETPDDFEDFIEKAETKALGRALAALGYGTQFCEDFDFSAERRQPEGKRRSRRSASSKAKGSHAQYEQGARVVDAPVARLEDLKAVQDRPNQAATSPQVKAIYAIGRRQYARDQAGMDERCREAYGCPPGELSKRQASEFIDLLRQAPAEAEAPNASVPV